MNGIQNEQLIQKLDLFIKKYYKNQIIRGVIFGITGIVSFFIIVSLLEYFGQFNTQIRTILFYSFVIFGLSILSYYVLIPLLKLYKIGKTLDYKMASQIIGTHFTEIKDRLINTLQLSEQYQHNFENQFLAASINQKIEKLKPVTFHKAIDFNKNKKYLKYAIFPLATLILILLIAPGFTDTTKRLINHNTFYAKKAPFQFILENKNLSVSQNEDIEINVKIEGNMLPDEVYLNYGENDFKMKKTNQNLYSFLLKNLQKSEEIQFKANGFESNPYLINVFLKPSLDDFSIYLDYPAYTQKKDELLKNIGDLSIPQGTKINWKFNTRHVDGIQLIGKANTYNATQNEDNEFEFSKQFLQSENIKIKTYNKNWGGKDSISCQIMVVQDAFPNIGIKEIIDSTTNRLLYFVGDINDDYGFTKLQFVYKLKSESNNGMHQVNIPISKNNVIQSFFYTWDINNLKIEPGTTIEYYFEVYDNDAINGAKVSRSIIKTFSAPTLDQLEKQTEKTNEAIKSEMADAVKDAKQLESEIKKLQQKLTEKKTLTWEDKKQIEDLLKKQKELEERMKDVIEQNKQKNENENEFKEIDEELLEKQEELEKLFEELMDEEMKQLLEKMKQLLDQNKKDNLQDELDKFKLNDKELKKKMERALELFKQLELEKKIKETTDKLDELSKEQEKLSKESEEGKTDKKELEQKQEELNKKFDEIKKDLQEIEEKNKKLEDPNNIDDTKEQQDKIEQEQKQSSDNIKQNQKKKAAQNQKKAAEEMKKLSEQMEEMMEENEEEKQEEDYNTLREILENLVQVSFDQEALMKDFKTIGGYNPKFVELAQKQKKLRDDTKLIEDSLLALSKRVIQIKSFINKEIGTINSNMDKAMVNLGFRNIPDLSVNQQYIMTSLNNLALMLTDVLQNMQEQMKSKPNDGKAKKKKNCKNPGSGKPSLSEMKKMQQQMNEQMEQMLKEGKKPGSEGLGKDGNRPSSKDIAKMAAQQAALRKKLGDLQKQLEKEGNGKKLGDLKKTQDLIDEVEKDLVNKNITEETLKRQREILTRLLEHEKAEQEQQQDDKRESNEGIDKPRPLPPSLQLYLKEKMKEKELLKNLPPDLTPYFKEKVKEYYQKLGQ